MFSAMQTADDHIVSNNRVFVGRTFRGLSGVFGGKQPYRVAVWEFLYRKGSPESDMSVPGGSWKNWMISVELKK